ncbi:MAG: UDP-3-O-(3-hydroxymyristoyl)glucosamine N-acyltransferase [Ruminococcus sp.]|nr:UDP-3-O-(3-hydroxymyristoyl)glucosamine N-acyltransferase [Ruminococcus sp.]
MMNNFVTVGELADFLGCPMIGERNKKIFGISLFQDSTDETLTYIPWKDINKINDIDAGAILTRASIGLPIHRNYIITKHEPYEMLAKTIQFLIDRKVYEFSYNNKPYISPMCKIGNYVTIGNNSVVDENTELFHGVVIGRNVKIGKNCRIGSNTVIGDETTIGDNTIIGACCNIGVENFEYQQTNNGWIKIPVVGSVLIEDCVEIGGNVVIEKGTIGKTIIKCNTQIDNLVQIGHEVKIGTNCHIVACVALAGWSEIGNNVTIYGQSAVCNSAKVNDNVVLLGRTGVDKDVKENQIVSGFPAQEHKQEMKFQAYLRKLFRNK